MNAVLEDMCVLISLTDEDIGRGTAVYVVIHDYNTITVGASSGVDADLAPCNA